MLYVITDRSALQEFIGLLGVFEGVWSVSFDIRFKVTVTAFNVPSVDAVWRLFRPKFWSLFMNNTEK